VVGFIFKKITPPIKPLKTPQQADSEWGDVECAPLQQKSVTG